MILSKINRYSKLSSLTKTVQFLRKKKRSKNVTSKLLCVLKKKFNYKKVNQNKINYIINVIALPSNTVINLTNIDGKVINSISSGLINLSKELKKPQPLVFTKILKSLLLKSSFIKNKAIALNFKNVRRHHEIFCINLLQNKAFIKSVQSYSLLPHNGCRPKKFKKTKLRTKRLVIK